jgi:O-antigen ligase
MLLHNDKRYYMTDTKRQQRFITWPRVIALCLLLAYFLRVTIPALWLKQISVYLINFSGYYMLAIAFLYLGKSVLIINPTAAVMLGGIGLTTLFSTELELALSKWALWGLLVIVVGPFINSQKARYFRSLLWRFHKPALYFVAVLSFVWFVLGLPQYGKGISGITLHSMALGPIAGIAAIYALTIAVSKKSRFYWLLTGICFLSCLISGARSALLGLFAGASIFPIMQIKNKAFRWIVLFSILLGSVLLSIGIDMGTIEEFFSFKQDSAMEKYTAELMKKGLRNSRTELWELRWNEFESSPLVGVGIGVDVTGGLKTEYGTVVVEPGSSYLAVLSMTGIVGAVSLFVFLISIIWKFKKNWDFIPITIHNEMVSIGIFWAIYSVSEGSIYAVGSIFCMLFWLWVSQLSSLGSLNTRNSTTKA